MANAGTKRGTKLPSKAKETEEVTVQPEVNTGVTFEGADEAVELVEVVQTPPKSVKVRMATDHRCAIGGVRYDLVKGKVYTVPENVRRVLNSAGLLAPL